MLTWHTYYWSLAIWAAVTVVAWAAFVPDRMSGATLGWMSAAVIALCVVAVSVVRAGRSPRSIAQLLYDTEHPAAGHRRQV